MGLGDAGKKWVGGLGCLKPGVRKGGPVWRAKLKIALYGRDISGTWGEPPDNGSIGSWDEGEGASCEPGGPGAQDAQGDWFGGQNQNSHHMGAISVGSGKNPQLTAAGGCGMRERGPVTGLGGLEPETHRGTGLAGETENCAIWAQYRWDLGKTPC
jgi:hypothetical protein